MVYRNKCYFEELLPKLEEFAGHNITCLVSNNFEKNALKYYDRNFNRINKIYCVQDLLDGKLDKMKFDYIIGNPPYQYPKGNETSKKLYIDVTNKILPLLRECGEISFITPYAIINDGAKNKAFNELNSKIVEINLNTNDFFNIGQNVISWKLINKVRQNKIKVIRKDDVIYVEKLHDVCFREDTIRNNICNKLNYKLNNKDHLYINDTTNEKGLMKSDLSITKDDEYKFEVITSSQKNRIQYTNKQTQERKMRIIIPMQGGYLNGCEISDKYYSNGLMINNSKTDLPLNELKNIKQYLESPLIKYAVLNYNKIYPKASYAFLFLLSTLDFSKSWTDEMLYAEFGISESEIQEINNFS